MPTPFAALLLAGLPALLAVAVVCLTVRALHTAARTVDAIVRQEAPPYEADLDELVTELLPRDPEREGDAT